MFDDTLVEPVPRHSRLATAFAVLSHFFVIGLVVAITSARPAALFIKPPCSDLAITHVTFRPPSPPLPPGPPLDPTPRPVRLNRPTAVAGDVKAEAVNDESESETNENSVSGSSLVVGGICGCMKGGIVGGLASFQLVQLAALPAGPALPTLPSMPLRAGRGAPIPSKLVDVKPTYPPLARHLRTQGTVVLDAGIDETGRVVDVRVLQSIALLDRAAIDAVRRWRYAPAVVNGRAVPVILTVTVAFVL
jgi:periplasmic protein TonB